MNIAELFERARARLEAKSDRALYRRLGITHHSFSLYMSGDGFPSDETMLRVCAAADVSEREGLLLLNMWRARGRAATIYRQLWQDLRPDGAKPGEAKSKTRTGREQINAQ